MISIDLHHVVSRPPSGPVVSASATALEESDLLDYSASVSETLDYYGEGRSDLAHSGSLSITVDGRSPWPGALAPGRGLMQEGARGMVARLSVDGALAWIGVVARAEEMAGTGATRITCRAATEPLGRARLGDAAAAADSIAALEASARAHDPEGLIYADPPVADPPPPAVPADGLDPDASLADSIGAAIAMTGASIEITPRGYRWRPRSASPSLWRIETIIGSPTVQLHDETAWTSAELRPADGEAVAIRPPAARPWSAAAQRTLSIDSAGLDAEALASLAAEYVAARAAPRQRITAECPLAPVSVGDLAAVRWGDGAVPGPLLPSGGRVAAGVVIERSIDIRRRSQRLTIEESAEAAPILSAPPAEITAI